MKIKEEMNTYRTTATVVGIVYLAGFVVGLAGTGLIQSTLGAPDYLSTVSAKSIMLAGGAILWLMAAAGDAAHGILMLPVLKPHSERLASGYLASRIIDSVFLSIHVLFVLLQIPIGSAYLKAGAPTTFSLQALSTIFIQAIPYVDGLGWIALGLAGLMLNYLFYRARLVPRWIAIWGLVGYAIICCGMVSELMGTGLGLVSELPGGLWEVFVGGWLIVKGFNASAFTSQTTGTNQPAAANS
ncbi:hypothetical protein KSF_093510 [Reticulibacter mediterranei]|uniref:DUF4386 domain-containing protein n=1 Tax=Reticulibacter mediterranei TaxID=2778369 RepID=A0A8J3IRZ7_9CHLR|nr:DUF4386 domain-containing protein [Reticulibacter mediterranei]GHO99303.1 hypothetical protein KSF_093510 [Reticulibacter mediterranei]